MTTLRTNAFAAIVLAAATAGTPDVAGFLHRNAQFCASAPSTACVDRGFAFLDENGDGYVTTAEAEALMAGLQAWVDRDGDKLSEADFRAIQLALLVVQTVGVENILASYDTNHDGRLTKTELLADVTLDQRPLPQVLADRRAVNWHQLLGRLGPASLLLKGIVPGKS